MTSLLGNESSSLDAANALERTRAVLLVARLAGGNYRVEGLDLGLHISLILNCLV
jgi:hypothetical protein